jgi:hypothetical protein
VRSLTSVTALVVAGTLIGSNIAWAGSAGRRNTALAATALAVGAWSNGTGKAGRKNTALLATAGAAYAWKRLADKKKEERHRPRLVRLTGTRPVYVTERPARTVYVADRPAQVVYVPVKEKKCDEHPGRHLGWYKHGRRGHHDDDDGD